MFADESPCGLSDCSLELGSSEDWTIDASVEDGCFCEGLEDLKPVDSCVMIWDAVRYTFRDGEGARGSGLGQLDCGQYLKV